MPTPIYMLRRCLPLWKADAAIDEAIAFCRRNRIGEVIWKIDPEDFNHGFTPENLQRQYVEKLKEARKRMDAAGLVMSINPWLTQNHVDRNRYPGDVPDGYSWRVCGDGTVAREMACPLASPAWLQWLVQGYELYASVKPARIWIEDDFKTFSINGGEMGCFCQAHLDAFGWKGTREELVAQLKEENALRASWMDFNAGILLDICRKLEEAVHRVSPGTRIGHMCSWSSDGRWWKEAGLILAGSHRPLARTSLAPYYETVPNSVLPDSFDIWKEMACLPENTENCPELENWPYGIYSKSAASTRLQILTAFASGSRSITMNLYDMLGTPIRKDDPFAKMVRGLHPFLEGWNRLRDLPGQRRGINIPFNPRFADYALDKNGNALFDGDKFALPLQAAGLPVVFNCPDAACTALTGNCVDALSDDDVQRIFSKAVFVDGRAAAALARRGYAELLGVDAGGKCDLHSRQISAERAQLFLGKDAHGALPYLTLNFITACGAEYFELKPLAAAQTASVIVDNDHRELLPAWTVHRNRLGGRVAVCAYDLNDNIIPGFISENRARQLCAIYRWMLKGVQAPELVVDGGSWKMPFLWETESYSLCGLVNFGLDAMTEFTLTLPARRGQELRFRQLMENGKLVSVKPGKLRRSVDTVTATFRQRLEYGHAAIFRITRS